MINKNHKHGMYGQRLYRIWHNMITRCTFPSHKSYSRYGGRGIIVCEEWKDFISFKEWAFSHGYLDNLSIDRIDNNGNYTPTNCRWATRSQQELNKKKTGMEGIDLFMGKYWRARIKRNGKTSHIGLFKTQEEAQLAKIAYLKTINEIA